MRGRDPNNPQKLELVDPGKTDAQLASAKRKRKKRRAIEGGARLRQRQLFEVYKRDKAICYWCGKFVPREEASREHLFRPIAEYPHLAQDMMYQALAHRECNR